MPKILQNIKSIALYKTLRRFEQEFRKSTKKLSMQHRLKKADPVFIYQMGKVASSSIHHSLNKQYAGPVAHAHHIGSENWASELFHEWYKQGKRLKIISPIRDPIGFNISSFFQNFENICGTPLMDNKITTDEMIQIFLNKCDHDAPLRWFDENIKKHFNIDVYESTFPDCGYKTYQLHNADLLVFHITVNDSTKEKIIKDFLELPTFNLHNRNISSQKSYHKSYINFKESLKLPESYLSKMGEAKFFTHFFTKPKIDEILLKYK